MITELFKNMSYTAVLTGYTSRENVESIAVECPFCHTKVTPEYLFLHEDVIFALCPNSHCNMHFILNSDYDGFSHIQQNAVPKQKQFSEIIKGISPVFVDIFNQSFHAEQVNLDQICGVGYRKALEFLIKDYLLNCISKENKEQIEEIKTKKLGRCISEYVSNDKIKAVAQRAVWLGNDETHYVRKWTEKDVSHLKGLIDLTVRWIESEVETQQLLKDMPDPR